MSSVMAIVACPNISETTLGLTFLDSSSVAHVCRKSWKRISGSAARLRSGLKRWAVTCWRESGSSVSEVNIRPFSRHSPPGLSPSTGAPGGF
jgi:hypothetical protein